MMHPYLVNFLLALSLTAVSCVILALFVLSAAPKQRLNQIFALFCASIALWSSLQIFAMVITHEQTVFIIECIEHIGVILIPVLFAHYALLMIERPAQKFLAINYLIALLFILLLPTKLLIAGADAEAYAQYGFIFLEPGPYYWVVLSWFFVPVCYGLLHLFLAYRKATGARKNQLRYAFWGACLGYLGGCGNFLYVYDITIPWFNPHGTYGVPLYMAMTAYAIVRHRMMDIKVVIKKTFIYTGLYSLCLAIFGFVVFYLGQWVVLGEIDPRLVWISMVGLLLVITMVRPLDRYLTRLTERIFFKERIRYQQTLKAASAGMGRIRNLSKLLTLTARVIVNSVKVEHATIFLKDPDQPHLTAVASRGRLKKPTGLLKLDSQSPIVQHLSRQREPMVLEELKAQLKKEQFDYTETANLHSAAEVRDLFRLADEMERMQAAVCVPSLIEGELKGILMLGEKLSGDMYNQEDLDIFATLANQAALAIENAQAYDELINTRDQLLQSERLATIGKFASDMAHEIKNPLQAIMTFFEYFPERYRDADFRNRFAKIAQSEAKRIDELVRDLVHYSRPKPPQLSWVDITQVIESVLNLLENDFIRHRITVKKEIDSGSRLVEADRNQMKQIFLNLILNSIDALAEVPDRKRLLEIKVHPGAKITTVTLQDTGCGIPSNHLSALFTPFFSTKEKGSGLGLSIVQNILQAHQAQIEVNSQVDSGTTLTVRLPQKINSKSQSTSQAA